MWVKDIEGAMHDPGDFVGFVRDSYKEDDHTILVQMELDWVTSPPPRLRTTSFDRNDDG